MIEMTLRTVAEVTGGRLVQNGSNTKVSGFSTDSRSLQPGELFIPLRGEHYDGHDFLAQAARHGAAACLSEEMVGGLTIPVVQVDDSLKALGDLAAAVRNQFRGPVVSITGTTGKTTTKEMLASILMRTGDGLKSAGNYNNLIGVPLTLFGLQESHQWAVVEMGMSERGEIARLTEITAPQIGVITNVGRAHLASMENIDAIARAKGELFANLSSGGTAVANADDPYVVQLPVANGVRRVLYGLSRQAHVRAEQVIASNGAVKFVLLVAGEPRAVRLSLPGRHNVMNALAAAAAAQVLEVSLDDIVAGLENFKPVPGRMELIGLAGDVLLLEDSYNANPLSMRAALDALHDLGGQGRRIALLGDMLELGLAAKELHREIGVIAAGCVDWLFVFGDLAAEIGQGAIEAGFNPQHIVAGESHAAIAARLASMLQPGDRVLLKGSRGMHLEKIVALLRAAATESSDA